MHARTHGQLLDPYPLLRTADLDEARERIGRAFSPHRLQLCGHRPALQVHHNQLRLPNLSLNVLRYGAEVLIDPGRRGDFYLVQLPLQGQARLDSGRQQVQVDAGMLSVLQPGADSRMRWSSDCTMLLLQVPRPVVHHHAAVHGDAGAPRFALARPRTDPDVAAWWQAVLDLTHNLHRFGAQWLQRPAAAAAMEAFLLSAFSALLREPADTPTLQQDAPADARCLRRAKDYMHAHGDRALTLAEIAEQACVSPRTLEAVFKRHGEPPPLAYARRLRLQAVHAALQAARADGRALQVTDVALAHGFVHMGRFAAQYRQQFGCAPSETLRPH